MLRLFLYILGAWILFKIIRVLLKNKFKEKNYPKNSNHTPILKDELVKDNICQTYIPKSKAIILNHSGQILHFCSENCKNKFLTSLDGKKK